MVTCSLLFSTGHEALESSLRRGQRSSRRPARVSSLGARHRGVNGGRWFRDDRLARLAVLDDNDKGSRWCCPDRRIACIDVQLQRSSDEPTAGNTTATESSLHSPTTELPKKIVPISPTLTPTGPRTSSHPPGHHIIFLIIIFFLISFFIFFIIGEVPSFNLFGHTTGCNYVYSIYGPIWYPVAAFLVGVGVALLLCPSGTTGNPVTHVVLSITCVTPNQKMRLRIGIHLAGSKDAIERVTVRWSVRPSRSTPPSAAKRCSGSCVVLLSRSTNALPPNPVNRVALLVNRVANPVNRVANPVNRVANPVNRVALQTTVQNAKSVVRSHGPIRRVLAAARILKKKMNTKRSVARMLSRAPVDRVAVVSQHRSGRRLLRAPNSWLTSSIYHRPSALCRKGLRLRHNILVTKKPKCEPDNICCDKWTGSMASDGKLAFHSQGHQETRHPSSNPKAGVSRSANEGTGHDRL